MESFVAEEKDAFEHVQSVCVLLLNDSQQSSSPFLCS